MAEDLRLQKTYNALTEAFSTLISQKSFEQITVKELCAAAKTRTATFYSHFSDKYDFFAFMVKRMRDEFTSEARLPSLSGTPKGYFAALIGLGFDFIEKNESFLCALDSNSILSVITHTTTKDSNAQLTKHFADMQAEGIVLPIEPEIMTEMLIGAMSQTSRWWFAHRKEITKEEMVEKLSNAFEKMLGL